MAQKYRSLRSAARDGNLPEVRRLCEAGADIDAQDGRGYFPLGGAVANGHVDVAEYLLGRGADINQASQLGWRPVFTAVQRRDAEMLRLLLKYAPELDARTEMLLGRWDSPIPGVSPAGFTALHQAAAHKRDDLVALLLEAGANPNLRDDDGRTPLHLACERSSLETVVVLLRHGANPALADRRGTLAIDQAACSPEIREILRRQAKS